MKLWPFIMILTLAAMAARADEIKPGDSYEQVIAELGRPQGEISSGDFQLLDYPRGKVELRGGKVSRTDLISEEKAAEKQLLREKQLAEAQKASEEARAHRIVEGVAIRKSKLADTAFMGSPVGERVAFWQGFKKQYPEVALGDEYAVALKELELQYAAQRIDSARQQQIDHLEARVADAEDRARRSSERQTTVIYEPPIYYGYTPGWIRNDHHAQSLACRPGITAQFNNGSFSARFGSPAYVSPSQHTYVTPRYLVPPFSDGSRFYIGGR